MLTVKTLLNKKGDTIVEVLIALTILSLAMSISYATVNSSIQGLLVARTTAKATSLLQQQVETLRITSNLGSNTDTTGFCFDGKGSLAVAGTATCVINNTTVKITEDGAGSGKFTATATWTVGPKTYNSSIYYAK